MEPEGDHVVGRVIEEDGTEEDGSVEEAQLPNNSHVNSSECSLEGNNPYIYIYIYVNKLTVNPVLFFF